MPMTRLLSTQQVAFYSNKDAEVIQTVLNNEFSSMTNWLRNNELIINKKRGKTEVTLFGTIKRCVN